MKTQNMLMRTGVIICFLIVIISLPAVMWQLGPSKAIKVVIVDKTVPDTTYREHSGLMWILNHLKIVNPGTNAPFKYNKDYYGFFPLPDEKYVVRELPSNLDKPDLIYLTDAYGVYENDFFKKGVQGNRSQIIYGGLRVEEVKKIKESLDRNTLVSEFNTLASPTENQARTEMENMIGMKWNNWIGRYFSDLSKDNPEIPVWMRENYAMQFGVKWDFKGAGIVLVDSNDSVIVLREGVELGDGLNRIAFTDSAVKEFEVRNNVNYYYWFDICQAAPGVEVLAEYHLDVTEAGAKLLKAQNLPSVFPAIVKKTGNYTSYYFAGDYADSISVPPNYAMSGIPLLNKFTTFDDPSNQNYFYWNVYYPLLKVIIKNAQ